MSAEFSRADRIAVMMQRKLTHIIQHEIKDPRLSGWITLSDLTITKDLRYAKAYFTVFNGDSAQAEIVLNAATGYIRRLLAKTLDLRVVPDIRFIYDNSVAYGNNLSRLIDDVNVSDNEDEGS